MTLSPLPLFSPNSDALRLEEIGIKITMCGDAEPSSRVVPLDSYLTPDDRSVFTDRGASE